jgi:predicted SAM-dependent methyltransferase
MELIQRKRCVFTDQEDLELLHCFPDFPIFMGCVDHPPEQDLKADMKWHISRSSGSLQLNPLIPLEILYGKGHGSGSVGSIWARHHRAFAKFIASHKPSALVEIGGGHGILAHEYLSILPKASWTIVEPNPTALPTDRIHLVTRFFDENFHLNQQIDAVVHSHVLEHMYEPISFLRQLNRILPEDGHMYFSVPNFQVMLARGYTNCVNFEHTCFMSEPYIEYSLHVSGFQIDGKEYFLDDHSIFYSAKRNKPWKEGRLAGGLYSQNRQLFLRYVNNHKELVVDLNQKLSRPSNPPVYLFGAHIFSQYLLAFGLDWRLLKGILDNDQEKQGKRLYGTQFLVQSPKILAGTGPVTVILRAGAFQKEIKEDILNHINPGAVFWE